jgi:pentatricopeptide repeat protein
MTKNEHLNAGLKKFSSENYEDAIEDFKEAIAMDQEFDLAYNALIESYNRLGQIDKAIEVATQLVEITPNDPIVHTALSRLYVQKGMIAEAEKELAISNQLAQ